MSAYLQQGNSERFELTVLVTVFLWVQSATVLYPAKAVRATVEYGDQEMT